MFIDRLKYYIIFVTVFFSWANFASANLEITEIMYNSKGADVDWIEIYNPDGKEDITKIKLLVSNSESNHGIVGYDGSQYLEQGEYGIIVVGSQISSFLSKWGGSAIIFTSSFSLPNLKDNEEATVSINNGNKNLPIDLIYYKKSDGASDNGNSLQKIDNEWGEAEPTPGGDNQIADDDNSGDEENTTNDNINTSLNSNSENKVLEPLKITTKIISPKIVIARTPFSFGSLTTTNRGETYEAGKWIWNFGDGMISQVNGSGPFEYLYEYPGEYALTLSYFDNNFTQIPDATDKMIIKVLESEVYISAIGDSSDPFIEIENKSKYEVNLSNWIITAGTHLFNIPEGTILLPDRKIKLSPKITGFTLLDLSSITITNSNNFVIATYPIRKRQLKINANNTPSVSNKISPEDKSLEDPLASDSSVINLNDLGASASNAKVNISNLVYSLMGLILIIGLGSTSFLLIKKKNNTPDYIDKEIRAEDMTIIE